MRATPTSLGHIYFASTSSTSFCAQSTFNNNVTLQVEKFTTRMNNIQLAVVALSKLSTMKPSTEYCGKYQMTDSENFDDFMAALGIGYLTRKLGNASKPLITISEVDATASGSSPTKRYSLKQESLVKTTTIEFALGEQIEETTADGRKCKTTFKYVKPGLWMQEMLGTNGGKDSVCLREFFKAGMKVTCTVDNITTVRNYKRV